MRINTGINRGNPVTFSFNGKTCSGYEGESVACALYAAGIKCLRDSPSEGMPRGMFCLMGSCQECLVWIEGRKLLSCQQNVAQGLEVHSVSVGEQ